MDASQLHYEMLRDHVPRADGVPYGVHEFGGDVDTNKLCIETLRATMELQPPSGWKQIMEIGSGGGRWTRWLRPQTQNMVCVDRGCASKIAIDRLKLTGPIMHLFAPWGTLPTAAGSPLHQAFDLVFTYDTFVHFSKPLIQTYIRSISQALAPGAHAVIHVASSEERRIEQPQYDSGTWCVINDATFNALCYAQGLHLVKSIRATEGFGSRVCLFRKD